VPRDIESFCFQNKIDLSKYHHNKQLTNATKSQQYIMDLIDKKFEKLKDHIYKLGISPQQFRSMVENQALFEWSTEVALALGLKYCSWVVPEENEDEESEEEITRSPLKSESIIKNLKKSMLVHRPSLKSA
jgi:uncharacterized protein YpmB